VREPVEAKGRRYLVEGRLVVEHVAGDMVRARCRGGGAVYELGLEAGGWWCSCLARGRCSHLVALQLVTVADAGSADGERSSTGQRAAAGRYAA
jgi:uncharacterized Zn finger protein